MPARASRRLVIDASVAAASGGRQATFPTSKNCRDFLTAVRRMRHVAVMPPQLKSEWDAHMSQFARTWLTSMVSRGDVIFDDVPPSNRLRRTMERAAAAKADERRAMRKDFHLVEAAMATDRTVISLDEIVRALFVAAASNVAALRKIVWVNPDTEPEDCLAWLEARAKPERKRMLGYGRADRT